MGADRRDDRQDREVFDRALCEAAAAIGLHPPADQRERMFEHFDRMVETNRQFNLTRITRPAEAAVKHYVDSLTLLACPWFDADQPLTVIDVGTGAGFPAVPLAIVCPRWSITAIDGTAKKARFVSETAAALGLANLHVLHARAEDLKPGGGERFDLVLMRAVSPIATGLKRVGHLVGPSGSVVFYKTPGLDERELSDGRRIAHRLGLQLIDSFDVTLPAGERPLERRLLRFRL
jgi:16S rRNA (guanine527-N7)-methyltransferase